MKVTKDIQLSRNILTVDKGKLTPLGQHNENAIIVGTTPSNFNNADEGNLYALEITKISKTDILDNIEDCLVYISTNFPSIDEIIKVVAPNDEKGEYSQIYRKNDLDCYCFKAVSFSFHTNMIVDYIAHNMPLSDIRDFSGLNVFLMPKRDFYINAFLAFMDAGIFFKSSPIIGKQMCDEPSSSLIGNSRIRLFNDFYIFFQIPRLIMRYNLSGNPLEFSKILHLSLGETYSESILRLNDVLSSRESRTIAENLILALVLGAYIKKDVYLSAVRNELLNIIPQMSADVSESEINKLFDETSKDFYEE